MKKFRKIIALVLALSFIFLTLAVGCAPARRPAPQDPPNTQDDVNPRNNIREDNNLTNDTREANKEAERLAAEASKVKGVKSATVVLSGNTAFVGLDMNANIEAEGTSQIKREVTNRIKAADKEIKTVSIATDADTVTRIRNVARGIADGRPISQFANELEEIARRITPSLK